MLQALASRRTIGPGSRAVRVRRPQQAAAAAVARLHRGLPERHDHRAIGLAHAAPAGARIVEPHPARFEGTRARHELGTTLEPRDHRGARRTAARALFEQRRAQGGELLLAQPLGVCLQVDELLPAELVESLACPGAGAIRLECASHGVHTASSIGAHFCLGNRNPRVWAHGNATAAWPSANAKASSHHTNMPA